MLPMKSLLLLPLLLFLLRADAQITLENTYPVAFNNNTGSSFGLDYYSYFGYKYFYVNNAANTITIYNLNHSVNRVITIPAQPTAYSVSYLTTQLFDTDSTDFEYIVESGAVTGTKVYDENGAVLLQADSFFLWDGGYNSPTGKLMQPIMNTNNGTKMLLTKIDQLLTKIFALPGMLPCPPCGNLSVSPPLSAGDSELFQGLSEPFPNPANGAVRIDYQLPEGTDSGEIVFYDLTGQEVKRVRVDRNFAWIEMDTAELAAGTYSYQLLAGGQVSPGKKIVVIH